MVNRLFMHKDYESIKPTYHCIIDNKLLDEHGQFIILILSMKKILM